MAILVHLLATSAICILFPLYFGWKLTLVIVSCAPFIVITTVLAEKASDDDHIYCKPA